MYSTAKRTHFPLAALLLLAACSAGSPAPTPTPAPRTVRTTPEAIAQARADSARLPYTAADVRFMTAMVGHHAQAVRMAHLVPDRTTNGSIRTLAQRIINAQQDEIVLMQQWLLDRNQIVPDGTPGSMKMKMNGMEHEVTMPGMVSPENMQRLAAARDGAFDRLFLTLMIGHHQGAVTMVKELFATYGAGQDNLVFKFASDVNVDQTTEINRMQLMLKLMPDAPGSP